MNPLDRINQLNDEVALLRSQLSDAHKQLEADSATIAKLAKDKHEILEQLFVALCFVEDCEHCEDYKPGIVSYRLKKIRETIFRHA